VNDQGREPPLDPEDGPQTPRPQPDSRRGAVIGLVLAIVLVLLGLLLVKILGDAGRLQDCAMSGRTNCAPIDPTPSQ
jgi:hypothetical protein